ncbi:hypothetical protein PORY_001071 [Pneumocystis oryctolagi]|uniref:Uncharacterized protein n=1 Tax=Pneumocystis oryctolagi TaxID=42067 RepID=A0ACB7CEN1_9ASCO|nr:hypothetical protein PORY_001071 [Pneumocystis oryctolagi]
MQENEILEHSKADENSLKKAVEMVFNEVYLKIVPNKFFEDQNLMKFEEKFQKAISYITTPKTYLKAEKDLSRGKNTFVGCVLSDSNTFLDSKNRPGQRRKRHLDDGKKRTLISRRVPKQDGRRSRIKSIDPIVFPQQNMYASKKGPKWKRNGSLSKSFIKKQNFQCLPIVPDVTEVIVNRPKKYQYMLYRPFRKINLDHLWMMHWKLKHQKKTTKKYSTRHILFRMLSKGRSMQNSK